MVYSSRLAFRRETEAQRLEVSVSRSHRLRTEPGLPALNLFFPSLPLTNSPRNIILLWTLKKCVLCVPFLTQTSKEKRPWQPSGQHMIELQH